MHKRIRELRKQKGLSQKEFAKVINLSQNHVSSLEKGTRTITDRTIEDICREFNVNKQWLLTGIGDLFVDELEKYDIKDQDVKEFAKMFLELDEETQQHITALMKKALGK